MNEDGTGSVAANSSITMTSSTMPTSAGVSTVPQGSTGASSIRVISSVTPYMHDLTALEPYMSPADGESLSVSVVEYCCVTFDLSRTDDDDVWTIPPDLQLRQPCHSECNHVRAVSS